MPSCNCEFDLVGEHRVDCPMFEPPLTQEELRILRREVIGLQYLQR